MTVKGKAILEGLEALRNNKWINEHKCWHGYYPVELLDEILFRVYENDFETRDKMKSFITNKVWHNMVEKGIIKLSKSGGTFKILV